jgi:transcriptional regulator with XRE-family HTH domain
METDKHLKELEKDRSLVASQVRALRQERRWTQAELASHLRLSQSRLSEIENGDGSFTAEQFLLILRLFNVSTSRFAAAPPDRDSELQNALARLGARHLHESRQILPSAQLDDARDVVRETLLGGTPRLITALAPVLVLNLERLNLHSLHRDLLEAGLGRRLAWLVENTIDAIGRELARSVPRDWAQRCRRAAVVLSAFLDSVIAAYEARPSPLMTDVLDTTIRSKQSQDKVIAASSLISNKWAIATRLQPEDFAEALRGARAGD